MASSIIPHGLCAYASLFDSRLLTQEVRHGKTAFAPCRNSPYRYRVAV